VSLGISELEKEKADSVFYTVGAREKKRDTGFIRSPEHSKFQY